MFHGDVLQLDLEREADEIAGALRETVARRLLRRGLVVAVSGGIDSSVTAALAVRALGPGRVFALLMPERDSSDEGLRLGRRLVEHLGVVHAVEDIQPTLDAIGCYRRYDAAAKRVFPDYGPGWRSKIVLAADRLDTDRVNVFRLVAEEPSGRRRTARLPLQAYLEIVAATSFKQRVRKALEYHHADRLNYAVAGTPNRLEYDQGFFVKNGDGAADVKPIAHLYKTQVYAMARHLGLPDEICAAAPTTDTYSLPQGQDEFYFVLPYREMDLLLWACNHDVPVAEAAAVLGMPEDRIARAYRHIERKRAATRPLHLPGLLLKDVPEITG
ncbi:MAG: NAD(+) synthase [Candidatus Krumholzibacteriia bacterium]